jgi:hypothetical protein
LGSLVSGFIAAIRLAKHLPNSDSGDGLSKDSIPTPYRIQRTTDPGEGSSEVDLAGLCLTWYRAAPGVAPPDTASDYCDRGHDADGLLSGPARDPIAAIIPHDAGLPDSVVGRMPAGRSAIPAPAATPKRLDTEVGMATGAAPLGRWRNLLSELRPTRAVLPTTKPSGLSEHRIPSQRVEDNLPHQSSWSGCRDPAPLLHMNLQRANLR